MLHIGAYDSESVPGMASTPPFPPYGFVKLTNLWRPCDRYVELKIYLVYSTAWGIRAYILLRFLASTEQFEFMSSRISTNTE